LLCFYKSTKHSWI